MRLFSSARRRVVASVAMAMLGPATLVVPAALGPLPGTGSTAGASQDPGGTTIVGATASDGQPHYYVSLGDSYAVGYQPAGPGGSPRATSGYTGVVASAAHLTLVNFGCPGATTTSVSSVAGCRSGVRPVNGAVTYRHKPQAEAAEAFVRAHRGHIALITVSIGGNDLASCETGAHPVSCVGDAVVRAKRNISTLARGLRAAAGPGVPLLGLTYPDVALGLWVYPSGRTSPALAALSVEAIRTVFNPALRSAYESAGGTLVDVTRDSGAYVPLSHTTVLHPYGRIPVAVAQLCRLTWYCTRGNPHATRAGYRLIGDAILAAYRLSHPAR